MLHGPRVSVAAQSSSAIQISGVLLLRIPVAESLWMISMAGISCVVSRAGEFVELIFRSRW
jgi:hypothetical protein